MTEGRGAIKTEKRNSISQAACYVRRPISENENRKIESQARRDFDENFL